MGCVRRIFNQIIHWLFSRRPSRPEDIPKKLDAQTLARAMEEARFLRSGHAVDVKSLEPGEIPGMPRRADSTQEP